MRKIIWTKGWTVGKLTMFFLLISMAITYPAFTNHYFKLTMDGQIHLVRFESIADALKSGQLPPLVNFYGFGHVGEVFNGTYPWLTGLIYVLPRMIFNNPMHALFVATVLLNMITMLCAYLLMSELTTNRWLKLTGTLIYQLNTYHMIDIYARVALGEAIAYAFLPLVFLGAHRIWHHKQGGKFWLALGMATIINSHILTTMVACLILLVVELYRGIRYRQSILKEWLQFIISGLMAFAMSIYSIVNVVLLYTNNHMSAINRTLTQISPLSLVTNSINNRISDHTVNIGIVCLILLVSLFAKSFFVEQKSWATYIWGAMGLFIITLNWIKFPKGLETSWLGQIQMLTRLYMVVVLFIAMSFVLYVSENDKIISWVLPTWLTVMMVSFSIAGIAKYHDTMNDDPIRYTINQKNYIKTIDSANDGALDYGLITKNGTSKLKSANVQPKINEISYDTVTFSVKGKKITRLPFFIYEGIKYTVFVNAVPGELLTLKLPADHKATVKITSKASPINYLLFACSIISLLMFSLRQSREIILHKR